MFAKLLALISEYSSDGFYDAFEKLSHYISHADDFMDILIQIGTIPEAIPHDSTEEKLFSKVSDAVLSRAFRELGLKSTVLTERADSADVIAESDIHGYSLVADAKAFRLSRTAKNQKDFKIGALSGWGKNANYAVLCSPYFQYPRNQSQIYAQSVDNGVCLLGWEHLIFMLQNDIRESEKINLSTIWNFSNILAQSTVVSEKKKNFIKKFDSQCFVDIEISQISFDKLLSNCVEGLISRSELEKSYWQSERKTILSYSHEQAIAELIKSKKIDEKIRQIDLYIRGISRAK